MPTPKKAPDAVAVVKAFNALEKAKLDEQATARLDKLTAFLVGFAPSPGTTVSNYDVTLVDVESPAEIVEARDSAVLAAFTAVRRIAAESSPIP